MHLYKRTTTPNPNWLYGKLWFGETITTISGSNQEMPGMIGFTFNSDGEIIDFDFSKFGLTENATISKSTSGDSFKYNAKETINSYGTSMEIKLEMKFTKVSDTECDFEYVLKKTVNNYTVTTTTTGNLTAIIL